VVVEIDAIAHDSDPSQGPEPQDWLKCVLLLNNTGCHQQKKREMDKNPGPTGDVVGGIATGHENESECEHRRQGIA
jgi:hypothetical protein